MDVRIRIPGEVYAGIPVPIAVSAENRNRWLPAFLIRVQVGDAAVLFPYIPARAEERRMVEFTFPERGIRAIRDVRTASVYPFNFFVRYRAVPLEAECTVFPHPVTSAEIPGVDLHPRHRGETSRERRGYDGDMLAIRDYMAGDSVRYINWKASARSGSLKTNELATAYSETSVIEFDRIAMPDLELKLSCLTSLIIGQCRKNRPIGLRISGRFFPPAATKEHKWRLLRELAVYGRETESHAR